MDDSSADRKSSEIEEKRHSSDSWKSSASSSNEDLNTIERDGVREEPTKYEGAAPKGQEIQSLGLQRIVSNSLSKITSRLTTQSIVDPAPPPDGGLQAWTQVAVGWLVIFMTWGWVNSYGAFQSYYTPTLPETASTISWIGSVQNFLTFFIGAFSGRLLDAGLLLPTLVVGGVIQVLGIFLMSLSRTYWQLMLTQGVMTGIGGGIIFTPCMGVVGTYFSSRRALAIGIASTGNSAGGMVYPVLVQQLLPKIGFAWTARVLGFMNVAFLALVISLVRARLPPRKAGPVVDFSAFRERTYTLFVAGLFFMTWPTYYTFYYLSSFGAEVLSMPLSTSVTLTIIVNGAGPPARIIVPLFADRWGQLNTMIAVVAGVAVVAWCWIGVHSAPGLYVYAVFYGLINAAYQCLLPSTVASITTDMSTFGTRLGMAFSTLSFAALTGPSLGGALQSSMGGRYIGAQVWAALSTTIACALMFASRGTATRWRFRGVKC